MRSGRADSVRQRLLNHSKLTGEDYNQVLTRYAGLRFLARLAVSDFAQQFVLKGATLFLVWADTLHRSTRDIDLLGLAPADADQLRSVVRAVCVQPVDEDGVVFDADSVRVEAIREESAYGGLRCRLRARLGSATLVVQLDVGFGDVVTPAPQVIEIPRLLSDETPRSIRAYTPETSIAEKLQIISALGLANSRMKDYFDIDFLIRTGQVSPASIGEAIAQTYRRRQTPVPTTLPDGLTARFWEDDQAQRSWLAFRVKNSLPPEPLADVCRRIGQVVQAALDLIHGPADEDAG